MKLIFALKPNLKIKRRWNLLIFKFVINSYLRIFISRKLRNMSWILEMDKPKQNILVWLPHSLLPEKSPRIWSVNFSWLNAVVDGHPLFCTFVPYFSPSSFVYINLIKIEWNGIVLSLLDNAPNYLVGCVIQKRSFNFSPTRLHARSN